MRSWKGKISIYFTFIMLLLSTSAESSIVYSGKINLAGPNFIIDINKDGHDDFITKWRIWAGGNGVSTSGFDAKIDFGIRFINSELGGIHAGHGYPGTKAPLDHGTLIDSTAPEELLWSYNSNDAMMWIKHDMWNTPSQTYSGVWNNIENKYVGFELSQNSSLYYGWIQLKTDNLNNIILVDYAYENAPNTQIVAGASPVPLPSTFVLLLGGSSAVIVRATKRNNEIKSKKYDDYIC